MIKLLLESKMLWSLIRHIRLVGPADDSGYRTYLRLSYNRGNLLKEGWYYRQDGVTGDCTYEDAIWFMKCFIKYDGLRRISFK